MDPQLVKRLLALNREFYAHFAQDFSDTRAAGRANIQPIRPYLANGIRVLDLGCGNGRLAERLDREGYQLTYVGLDLTPGLIEIAKTRPHGRVASEFIVADITVPAWVHMLHGKAPFDVVIMLAVLHHMPGVELRQETLGAIHTLLRPGGVLVMSNWQFTHNERLRNKIVPWQRLEIDAGELEEGDALLDWKRGGTGYRYVHLITEGEVQELAAQSGFQLIEQFRADAELNLWSVLIA